MSRQRPARIKYSDPVLHRVLTGRRAGQAFTDLARELGLDQGIVRGLYERAQLLEVRTPQSDPDCAIRHGAWGGGLA